MQVPGPRGQLLMEPEHCRKHWIESKGAAVMVCLDDHSCINDFNLMSTCVVHVGKSSYLPMPTGAIILLRAGTSIDAY